MSTVKKSTANTLLAWARRNCRQVSTDRLGAGSTPARWRMAQTVLYGNKACGVPAQDLTVPVAPDQADAALAESGTRPFDLTSADEGRPLVNLPAC